MVVLTTRCLARVYNRTFIDKLRIYVRGGTGGNGLASLNGIGGRGGDVYIVAAQDQNLKLTEFKKLHPTKRFIADPGENSQRRLPSGLNGSSIYVQVPRGVTVVDAESRKVLGEISNRTDKILVAKGGKGGSRWTNFLPRRGKCHSLYLDLKLIADVGFVGFPNAGKSTLLRNLSTAKPKVAEYPFTTVKPELGVLTYTDYRKITMADLPGLIEGAHLNKGRGHMFLKHIERTNILLFVVDVTGFCLSSKTKYRDAFQTVQLLTKELEQYDKMLVNKPAVLAVNKMDEDNASVMLEELQDKLFNWKDHLDDLPPTSVPNTQIKFRDVVPISAKFGSGTFSLKQKIRSEIDNLALPGSARLELEGPTSDTDLLSVESSPHKHLNDEILIL
ncbi:unnamed protein product [Clavelina lepadiformis]|uniref:GTP-binding protein 10 n=1 Tax=Clavelina lepadiformis TaxID=159417 RepID=A0ABP0GQM4_CLALP